jgi:hypothetical protein
MMKTTENIAKDALVLHIPLRRSMFLLLAYRPPFSYPFFILLFRWQLLLLLLNKQIRNEWPSRAKKSGMERRGNTHTDRNRTHALVLARSQRHRHVMKLTNLLAPCLRFRRSTSLHTH